MVFLHNYVDGSQSTNLVGVGRSVFCNPRACDPPIDEASQQVGVRYSVPRNDMMKRKKEAAKVAKATSEPPNRRSQISEGETTARSLSQSQLGSILEEMDDEADHPFCPKNDSESGQGMSKGRNTLS